MNKKKQEKERQTSEVEQVELVPEEFPEGPFGSAINKDEKVTGKSTPWKKGQRRSSAFIYADKEQHDELQRQFPGSHPPHDE